MTEFHDSSNLTPVPAHGRELDSLHLRCIALAKQRQDHWNSGDFTLGRKIAASECEITKQIYGTQSSKFVQSLTNLAKFEISLGQFTEASGRIEQASQIITTLLPDPLVTNYLMLTKADCELGMERYDAALLSLDKANKALQGVASKRSSSLVSRRVSQTQMGIALVLWKGKETQKSIDTLLNAARASIEVPPIDGLHISAAPLYGLFANTPKTSEGLQFLEFLAQHFMQSHDRVSANTKGFILQGVAASLAKRGSYALAADAALEAMNMFEPHPNPTHKNACVAILNATHSKI